ncbi:MAG TPA: tripartite tricarboxylate transporter substrate binding protein [Xanthobacteraceae bacterium]|jgi:tripartite-type tricarboxylate transporter receptor subunit TctC|nr:tripartite tricarboxylate transporter substrate binding protein [Xanthobacteraceae bacterium]
MKGGSWAVALLIALACEPALGETYPSRPVRVMVPASAGGVTDLIARITADYLFVRTNQRFVVENRTGAGGNLATEAVARAEPDGYTLGLVASGNLVINPYIYQRMPFDAKTDLVPVAAIAEAPQVIAINKDVPAATLQDLIAIARAKPESLKYASAGNGSTMHLAGDRFARLAGVKLVHVPYRGASPAVTDVVAGFVQVISVSAGPIVAFVRSGQLRVLAAASARRLKHFPDVPTSAEAGLPGYEMTTWFGLVAPRNTPDEIVQTLNGFIRDMLANPGAGKRLEDAFLDRMPMTQPEFAAFVAAEFPKWEKVVRDSGLQPD